MSTNRRHSLQHQLVSDTARAAFGDAAALSLSNTQAAALDLHRAGLNVFPLPYGCKAPAWRGYQYKRFRTARLLEDDVLEAFGGARVNIAIQLGRTSGNLFSIEAETAAAFGDLMAQVAAAGLPVWAVKSSRGGHVVMRCVDGEIANLTLARAREMGLGEVEIHGHNRYILAPESVHPDGTVYEFAQRDSAEPPTVTLDQLREIFPGLPFELASHTRSAGRRQDINERTVRLIQGRIPVGERNNQLYTSAREMLARGWDEDAVRHQLVTGAVRCGLDERAALATFQSAVKGHYRDQRDHTSTRKTATADASALWRLAQAWANTADWPGRTGTANRAAFLAHCERLRLEQPDAHVGQRVSWRCSAREGAELAGLTKLTFSRATRRLIAAGVLVLASNDTNGYRYTFGEQVVLRLTAGTMLKRDTLSTTARNSVSSLSVHPAFSLNRIHNPETGGWSLEGLGANAAPVLAVLLDSDKPLTVAEIAHSTGLSRSKVRRALGRTYASERPIRRLEYWRLVEEVDEGWIASVDWDSVSDHLDDVAIECGALTAARRRKASHQLERRRALLDIVRRARGLDMPRLQAAPARSDRRRASYAPRARDQQPTAAHDKQPAADLWGNVLAGDADRCPACGGPLWRRPSGVIECLRCGAELTRGAA